MVVMGLKIPASAKNCLCWMVFLPFLDPLHTIKTFSAIFPTRLIAAFPTGISHKIFLQDFPTRFSRKIFPQDFPELDPDWLALHHPIPNATFSPITAFLKLAFSPPPCPTTFSHKIFLQDFPELDLDWFGSPITLFQMLHFQKSLPFLNWLFALLPVPQHFPARISHKIFLSWILIGWLPITLFQMLHFHQSLLC